MYCTVLFCFAKIFFSSRAYSIPGYCTVHFVFQSFFFERLVLCRHTLLFTVLLVVPLCHIFSPTGTGEEETFPVSEARVEILWEVVWHTAANDS